jgi:bla regulator protein blaR1
VNSAFLFALGNHLWQSTVFAAAVACLTLVFSKNAARVRCLLWLAASGKFLVPFALLIAIGSRIPWPSGSIHVTVPALLAVAGQTAAQVTHLHGERITALMNDSRALDDGAVILIVLEVVWAVGTLGVAARWLRRWLLLRRALRGSIASSLPFAVPVRSSPSQFEPAVVGILQPVLLLPEGMERHLAPEELEAVLAHERCHVAWRDNLAASLHMLVEAIFWFHPLVWWLGSRIIDERERACDERVLAQGHASRSYAEGILKVCERYLQSPLASAAGVGGASLSQRIEAIMNNRLVARLGAIRKLVLLLVASATIAVPLAIGVLSSPFGTAAAATAEADVPPLRNVSIQLAPAQAPQGPAGYNPLGLMLQGGRRVQVLYPSLRGFIAAAYGVDASQVVGKDLSQQPLYQISADNPWPEGATDSGDVRTARFKTSLRELSALQRQLLATNFGLVVKRERRQMAGYVLSVSAGGSKLVPDSDAPYWKQGTGVSNQEVITTQAPVGVILHLLQSMFLQPVVDATGLTGTYDYKLTWKPSPPGETPEPATMAKALEEQLGLHLEARTVTVDVIDVISLKAPEQVLTSR